jgi:hypothetical protein
MRIAKSEGEMSDYSSTEEFEIDSLISEQERESHRADKVIYSFVGGVFLLFLLLWVFVFVRNFFRSSEDIEGFQKAAASHYLADSIFDIFMLFAIVAIFLFALKIFGKIQRAVLYKAIINPKEAVRVLVYYRSQLRNELQGVLWAGAGTIATLIFISFLKSWEINFTIIRFAFLGLIMASIFVIWYYKLKRARFCEEGFDYGFGIEVGFTQNISNAFSLFSISTLFWFMGVFVVPNASKVFLERMEERDRRKPGHPTKRLNFWGALAFGFGHCVRGRRSTGS